MNSVVRSIFVAVIMSCMFSPGVIDARQKSELDLAAIDRYIAEEMQRDRVPGVALAIVHNKQIVSLRGYGSDGTGNPVTAQTGFLLGSMSKSFTALAVMQLVERSQIDLDAAAVSYLPWFRTADASASARITVRHLLNHTSGIATNAPQAASADASLQDHVRALATINLKHAPGTLHEYASPNYLVLGAIIEQVSGQSFADYLQAHIFTPLDMQYSYTDQSRALKNGMARGHRGPRRPGAHHRGRPGPQRGGRHLGPGPPRGAHRRPAPAGSGGSRRTRRRNSYSPSVVTRSVPTDGGHPGRRRPRWPLR